MCCNQRLLPKEAVMNGCTDTSLSKGAATPPDSAVLQLSAELQIVPSLRVPNFVLIHPLVAECQA